MRSGAQLLLKAAWDQRLPLESRISPSSLSLVAYIFVKIFLMLCGFVLCVSASVALSLCRRQRSGFFAHRALCLSPCTPECGFCQKMPIGVN
ncbi:unnamed protein product [Coccothraustes coccothraustes]